MKKIYKILLTVIIVLSLSGCSGEEETSEGLKHVVNYESGALSDFSPEERGEILAAFNVVIPENETEAYIYSFVREYEERNGYEGVYYWLEIGGVNDYEAFFKANEGRVKKTVISPVDDPYTEEDETEGVEDTVLYDYRSLNEEQSFVEGMTTGEYYLTYGFYCSLDEETADPDYYALMKALDEVYFKLEPAHGQKGNSDG